MRYNLAPFCSQMQAQGNEHMEDKVGILLHQYYQDIEQLDLDILDIQVEPLVILIYINLFNI
jgi:hypothetical protein